MSNNASESLSDSHIETHESFATDPNSAQDSPSRNRKAVDELGSSHVVYESTGLSPNGPNFAGANKAKPKTPITLRKTETIIQDKNRRPAVPPDPNAFAKQKMKGKLEQTSPYSQGSVTWEGGEIPMQQAISPSTHHVIPAQYPHITAISPGSKTFLAAPGQPAAPFRVNQVYHQNVVATSPMQQHFIGAPQGTQIYPSHPNSGGIQFISESPTGMPVLIGSMPHPPQHAVRPLAPGLTTTFNVVSPSQPANVSKPSSIHTTTHHQSRISARSPRAGPGTPGLHEETMLVQSPGMPGETHIVSTSPAMPESPGQPQQIFIASPQTTLVNDFEHEMKQHGVPTMHHQVMHKVNGPPHVMIQTTNHQHQIQHQVQQHQMQQHQMQQHQIQQHQIQHQHQHPNQAAQIRSVGGVPAGMPLQLVRPGTMQTTQGRPVEVVEVQGVQGGQFVHVYPQPMQQGSHQVIYAPAPNMIAHMGPIVGNHLAQSPQPIHHQATPQGYLITNGILPPNAQFISAPMYHQVNGHHHHPPAGSIIEGPSMLIQQQQQPQQQVLHLHQQHQHQHQHQHQQLHPTQLQQHQHQHQAVPPAMPQPVPPVVHQYQQVIPQSPPQPPQAHYQIPGLQIPQPAHPHHPSPVSHMPSPTLAPAAPKSDEKPRKVFVIKDKYGNVINNLSELKNVKVVEVPVENIVGNDIVSGELEIPAVVASESISKTEEAAAVATTSEVSTNVPVVEISVEKPSSQPNVGTAETIVANDEKQQDVQPIESEQTIVEDFAKVSVSESNADKQTKQVSNNNNSNNNKSGSDASGSPVLGPSESSYKNRERSESSEYSNNPYGGRGRLNSRSQSSASTPPSSNSNQSYYSNSRSKTRSSFGRERTTSGDVSNDSFTYVRRDSLEPTDIFTESTSNSNVTGEVVEAEASRERLRSEENISNSQSEDSLKSLRSSGQKQRLNAGPQSRPSITRLTYTKEVLLKLKPDESSLVRPEYLQSYANIISIPVPNYHSSPGANGPSPSRPVHKQYNPRPHQQSNYTHNNNNNNNTQGIACSPEVNGGADGGGGVDSYDNRWKRDPGFPPQYRRNSNSRAPVPPRPKKVVSDALEKLTLDVRSILNKITPQTFEKLTAEIASIKITSSAMLDRLAWVIFEKAVLEQQFSHLYAELCQELQKISNCSYVSVVTMSDSNTYIWIRDVPIDVSLAGPYSSVQECINSAKGTVLPQTHPFAENNSIPECYSTNGVLVRVYKLDDGFYVGYTAVTELDNTQKSPQVYNSFADADADAKKNNSLRIKLLTLCQREFEDSNKKAEKYAEVDIQRREFELKKSSMSPTDIEMEEARLEELHGKLKYRTLGTIRFIGELYKCNLISSKVIHHCFTTLLSSDTQSNSKLPGEQELEALCRLIRTVGRQFEKKERANLENIMKTINQFAVDKRLNSRIRFALQEVIALKNNKWVERRVQEGPLKIDELQNKVAEEYSRRGVGVYPPMQSQSPQQSQRSFTNSGNNSSGNNNTKVLTRNSSGGSTPTGGNSGSAKSASRANDSSSAPQTPGTPSRPRSDSLSPYLTALSYMRQPDPSRLMQTLVDEYVVNSEVNEVVDILRDAPSNAVGLFVLKVFTKFVDTTQTKVQQQLLGLLHTVGELLPPHKADIFDNISSYEPFRLLSDTIVDNKKAPELMGSIIKELLSIGALDKKSIIDLVTLLREENLQFVMDPKSVDEAFDRFLKSIE